MRAPAFVLVAIGFAPLAHAQDGGGIVVIAGPSFSRVLSDFDFYQDNQTVLVGFNFGVGYRHRLSPHFCLQAAPLSEQKGFLIDDDFVFTDNIGNELGRQPMTLQFRYNYISLPLVARYNTTGLTYACASAGVVPSLLNTARSERSAINDLNTGEELIPASVTDLSGKYDQWDLGARLSIGCGRRLGHRMLVEINAEFTHGLLDMGNEDILDNYYLLNQSGSLLVNVVYDLTKGSVSADPEKSAQ